MFPWSKVGRAGPWLGVALAVAAVLAVIRWVDLSPRVEGEFFFADDDPQLAATRAVRETFRIGEQVIFRIRDPAASADAPAADERGYRDAIERLGETLAAVPGVVDVYSVVTRDVDDPLWSRILSTPDPAATNVVLQVDGTDPQILVPPLEAAAAGLPPAYEVVLSGAPVIIEWIRRSLLRDLIVFTTAAAAVFALVVALVYRDAGVVVGTLATGALSVSATLLALRAVGVSIGLLTANLATIVFVLTLSHVVFITANVRRAARGGAGSGGEAVRRGVADTFEGSFWGMTTTVLGFLSLLVATARPLRELGVAGAIGAGIALAIAYAVYPAFLAGWATRGTALGGVAPASLGPGGTGRSVGRRSAWIAGVAAALLAVGVSRVDTDPGLLSYFAPGSPLRAGLERIDADGGSSPLYLAVADSDSGRLDRSEAMDRLRVVQDSLDAFARTGVVLGPPVLVDQARSVPLAGLLPLPVLLDIASSPRLDEVALGFITADRTEALFSIRMREADPGPSRDAEIERLEQVVRGVGLETMRVAGLYELQGRLGHLIGQSVAVGIGGLLLLFLAIALAASRRIDVALKMWVCLAGVPLVVLGTFGWVGIAVDIITSPAANVALAIGVDALLHLVVRVRRFRAEGHPEPWAEGLARVRGPVLAATAVLGLGFGIFVLSTFPPTRRFGLAVILGTTTAAALALAVLPRWAGRAAAPREAPVATP